MNVLHTTYFGPVSWYAQLARAKGPVYIEAHENFIKQTARSRCRIATANGIQTLSIPVNTGCGSKCPISEVRITDHANWRRQHWNALCSAYGESPFFDYYMDDIRPFFDPNWDNLFDYNLHIIYKVCELLGIHSDIRLTDTYISVPPSPTPPTPTQKPYLDSATSPTPTQKPYLDSATSPAPTQKPYLDSTTSPTPTQKPYLDSALPPYYQVFAKRHGFIENLSILDLLFNEGNEAILKLIQR